MQNWILEKMCDEGADVDFFEDYLFDIKVDDAERAFVETAAAAAPATPPSVVLVSSIPAFSQKRKPVKRSLSHELELAAAEGKRACYIDMTGEPDHTRGRLVEVDVTGDEMVFVYQ